MLVRGLLSHENKLERDSIGLYNTGGGGFQIMQSAEGIGGRLYGLTSVYLNLGRLVGFGLLGERTRRGALRVFVQLIGLGGLQL